MQMKVRYEKMCFELHRISVEVCISKCVYVFAHEKSVFLSLYLLDITFHGSHSLTGECTLTKKHLYSSQTSIRFPKST